MDSNSIHSGSAMLMLLTVVFVGLAAFFIYKFKRCVRLDEKIKKELMASDPAVTDRLLLSPAVRKELSLCSLC